MNQRWLRGRDSYRRPDEQINTRDYEIATIPDDTTAKSFIEAHHYSGSYPAAVLRSGLFQGGRLVGVAVFSVPMQRRVVSNHFSGPGVELGRFVLLDEVPGNGETYFLGQAFRQVKAAGYEGVVSFSDPVPRTTADGDLVFPGHYGGIYQAFNATYKGRSTARTLRMLPNGRVLSDRVIAKIRKGDQGWVYGVEQMVRHGARPPACLAARLPDQEELQSWISSHLPRLTRRVRHPGNHRYVWSLRRPKNYTPNPGAYPKLP